MVEQGGDHCEEAFELGGEHLFEPRHFLLGHALVEIKPCHSLTREESARPVADESHLRTGDVGSIDAASLDVEYQSPRTPPAVGLLFPQRARAPDIATA